MDDSSSIRHVIQHLFEKVGFTQYKIFESGRKLLDEMKNFVKGEESLEQRVPLVNTDQEMPGMDGLSLCREVKKLCSTIEVTLMSSLASSQLKDKAMQVGVSSFVSKEDLASLIDLIASRFNKEGHAPDLGHEGLVLHATSP